MTDRPVDDTHTTLGESFRVPAHPDLLTALGRALWSFQALEGTVAILNRAGACTLTEARAETAGGKEQRLAALRSSLAADGADPELVAKLSRAVDAFGQARSEHRNSLSHIYGFMVGRDQDGAYLPGVAHTTPEGQERTLAESPAQLLAIAHQIEEAIEPLGEAREAVAAAFLLR